jgi:GAF domain-containing protein/anti-sigma regulatory factor (Ser/Thr protein kinase)
MKNLNEREQLPPSPERTLQSVRVVLGRLTDVLWQADPAGNVTGVTPCRPNDRAIDAELDDAEVAQIEQAWARCVRCVERFTAIYHVHPPGDVPRTFLVRAVPVLDERDAVLYWSGLAAQTDGLPEADTSFISEAASVLGSSLNRGTIVNRLTHASVDRFCDFCAVYALDDDGSVAMEVGEYRRPGPGDAPDGLDEIVETSIRSRQPLLRTWAGGHPARSAIIVPLLSGSSCVGALVFLESHRAASFAKRDLDVAAVVARQLSMALENIKTFEREQRLTQRFRFLARVTERLFATLDATKMLQTLLDGLVDRFADGAAAIDLEGDRLEVVAAAKTNGRLNHEIQTDLVTALNGRRSILVGAMPNVTLAGQFKNGPFADGLPPRSWMMVPLFSGNTVNGAIVCTSATRFFDTVELELLEEIGRRASLALEHAESFARERRLIQTLQQATLPTRLATVEGARLSAVYRPASSDVQVGGDWYDAYDLDEHRVLLTVGDVTGHGLEASIVMGKLRHAVNVVAMYEHDPARILDAAERIVLRRFPGSVATAFAAIFDSRSRTIVYANAGHPYPLVRAADGSLSELEAEGLPIGLRGISPPATSAAKRLDDVAALAFYTDGLVEATRNMLEGEQRLREAIASDGMLYMQSPARFVETFCLREGAPDDVAVLILNFVQSQIWTFDSSDWHAARTVRREFLAALEGDADPRSDFQGAELIFGELAANVAQYAAGPIDIALEWPEERAVLHVIDRGEGYAPTRDQANDLLTEHGRGLWLIRRLGAELSVEILPGFGTHVRTALPIYR